MAYTVELSMKSSSTLRKIAWTLDMPRFAGDPQRVG